MPHPPVRRVPAWRLQKIFNRARFWERAQQGEFHQVIISEGKNSPPHEPAGTRSQMVSYRDANGDEVARVHQYLRPDGTLGASGRPDPKRLFYNGVIYIYAPSKPKGHN